jgi:predicted transcriptional regulator
MSIPLRKPTEAELDILRVLWERGEASVREVHAVLNEKRAPAEPSGYTTVLKIMQIMTDKGLVTRREAGKAHIYSAAMPESDMQGQMLRDLSDKLFAGSTAMLAMHALSLDAASDEDLERIRALIERRQNLKR